MVDNTIKNNLTTSINWRLGALQLWIVASFLWCAAVVCLMLLNNPNANWFNLGSTTVHVKFSNSVTWDYPAEWGLQRITADLEKRVAEEDKRSRTGLRNSPHRSRRSAAQSNSTMPFANQSADCVRLFSSTIPWPCRRAGKLSYKQRQCLLGVYSSPLRHPRLCRR